MARRFPGPADRPWGRMRLVCALTSSPRLRSRRGRPGMERGNRRDMAGCQRRPRPQLHLVGPVAVNPGDPDLWYLSASSGPYAARRPTGPHLPARIRGWRPLGGGLPEPLPAMPYALVAADERLFAGLADGQIWQSGDRGETWSACAVTRQPAHEAPPEGPRVRLNQARNYSHTQLERCSRHRLRGLALCADFPRDRGGRRAEPPSAQSGRGRAHPGPSHTTGRAGPHPAVRVASRKRR
jgi:hypothetical protein